jgi:hypothetical protein
MAKKWYYTLVHISAILRREAGFQLCYGTAADTSAVGPLRVPIGDGTRSVPATLPLFDNLKRDLAAQLALFVAKPCAIPEES